jgi:hypothetical protein
MTTRTRPRQNRAATMVLLALALLLAAATIYILIEPVDASNFESTTGTAWDAFSTLNPEAADYLIREARLLAVGWLGFTLLAAGVVWWPLRRGDGWARGVLWLFPIALLGATAVFMASGDTVLGGSYLVAGVVAGVALAALRRGAGAESGRV